ncbi:MAG TPA: SBBP repeat-containing protein [Candidatus Sulfotelmatobacter sp.]
MFKPSVPRMFLPASWIVAVAVFAALGVALAGGLRRNSGKKTASQVATAPKAQDGGRVRASLAALPLAFEANQGQTDPQVKYVARGRGYTVFLTANDTVLAVHSSSPAVDTRVAQNHGMARTTRPGAERATARDRTAAIHLRLDGGNPQSQMIAGHQLPGHSNYFIGADRRQWHANVPQYARICYREAYPGVEMAFYGAQNQLEFDFIVAPGASPDPIRFDISGALRIVTDPSGNLILASSAGDVQLHQPVAYQQRDGVRQPVDARFVLRGKNQVSFELGNYDRSRELVIDPSVTYATYLGGTGEDDGNAIAVDGSGNAYVTGETKSTNFPGVNGGSYGGGFDVFVTKLSADGSTLEYSTYVGGSGDDSGNAIALDASGDAFVAGGTSSSNFPVTSAPLQKSYGGGSLDAFVFELSSSGGSPIYSTYLGGNSTDVANGIALASDGSGDVFVVGRTTSGNFPTTSPAVQSTLISTSDGFVTRLNPSSTSPKYSTYLGGSAVDFASAVAVDSSDNAYVTGATASPTFPNTNSTSPVVQSKCGTDGTCNGGLTDAFVSVIKADGSGFVYSTFLGGEERDEGSGIALDSADDAYVTGVTSSTKFPLQSPLQPAFGGGVLPSDAFVSELSPTGAQFVYSTYLGGSGDDAGLAIAVDGNKNTYVTGVTGSTDFPTLNPTQATKKGGNDAFVSEISAGGSALFSTYLGGSLNENTATSNNGGSLAGIAVDSAGANVYVTGSTASTDFPTVAAEQGSAGGNGDAFVAKYSTSGFTVTNGALSPTSGIPGVSATATITVSSMEGFSSAVTLACSVAPVVPKAPTCSFTPSTPVTPPANGTVTATLNLATTASSAMLERPLKRGSSGLVYAMLLPIGGMMLLGAGVGSARSRRRKLFGFLMLGMLLSGLLLMPACSSSSSGGGGGGNDTGTPTGTYTITVTGTSGSNVATGSPALSLTVN